MEQSIVKSYGSVSPAIFQSQGRTRIVRTRGEYVRRKEDARRLIRPRVDYFNTFYGFTVGRICIPSQKTRWGSCSKKGNLNFNYRVVHLSPELVDYIVVHELCHLAQLNHSKNFWHLVGRTIPDHQTLRKRLKKTVIS